MVTGSPRVLVAEDDAPVAAVVRDVLRDEGYEPVLAGSQAGALAALGRERFAAVLADCLTPVASGLEAGAVAALVRAAAGTPVVLCTARATLDGAPVAETPGVAAVVRKPFDLDDLTASVARVIALAADPRRGGRPGG